MTLSERRTETTVGMVSVDYTNSESRPFSPPLSISLIMDCAVRVILARPSFRPVVSASRKPNRSATLDGSSAERNLAVNLLLMNSLAQNGQQFLTNNGVSFSVEGRSINDCPSTEKLRAPCLARPSPFQRLLVCLFGTLSQSSGRTESKS